VADVEHLKILTGGVEAWNSWRKRYPKVKPDLSNLNTYSAELTRVNFRETNLHSANLFGARLYEADLRYADLRNADFTGGTLAGADLSYANLSGAKIKLCRLIDTKLIETKLTFTQFHAITEGDGDGADFSKATVSSTTFDHVDLRAFKGLDSVHHDGPSTLGIDTIYESAGKIPEIFLRGCGVPDGFITFVPSLVAEPIQFYSCFISYSHSDKSFAKCLFDTLQGRGVRCWLDEKRILPGDDIYESIDEGIRLREILLCCSRASLSSWWVDSEISKTFVKEQQLTKRNGKKTLALIPLNLDGYLVEWQNGKAEEVRGRLAADFKGWRKNRGKFDRGVESLIKALGAPHSA
jgi:hypothetical protein